MMFICYKNIKYFLFFSLAFCLVQNGFAQREIQIWDNAKIGNSQVKLTAYLPENNFVRNTQTAVIICPGGSYCWLDKNNESVAVARWLNKNGISAFVLKYRTAGVLSYITHSRLFFRGHKYPDMLHDLQRAIWHLRQNSSLYNINADRIGVMGFSAGGHLAIMSGTYNGSISYPKISVRPNFIASIYPVVTFSDKRYAHKRSRRGALGEYGKNNKTLRDSLSIEKHVNQNMPPVFIMSCKDDKVVDYRNSVLLDSALTAQNVVHKYVQYGTGGHGFGANDIKTSPEAKKWKNEFLIWLKNTLEYEKH